MKCIQLVELPKKSILPIAAIVIIAVTPKTPPVKPYSSQLRTPKLHHFDLITFII